MIEVSSVAFGYETVPVLTSVTCSIGPGLTLLVGPNGCGKSTLLKLLAGVERPDEGHVAIGGYDLWREEVAARRPLAYLPEHPDITPYASLLDVLLLVCRLRGEPRQSASAVLDRVGLGERAGASVRELSAGQRRRALIAAAWIGKPRVALLDEPLELLDRELRDRVVEWIAELRRGGATVMVISHQVEPFLAIADAVLTVREGKVVGPVTLPPGTDARAALVDRWARGELPRVTSIPGS